MRMRMRSMLAIGAMLATVGLLLGACGGAAESPTGTETSALEPEPTADVEYREEAQAILDGLADLLLGAATVLERADVESEAWRTEAREALGELRAHHEEAEQLSPPRNFEATHETLLIATNRIARAAELLADGLERQDADLLEAAAEQILGSVAALEEARLALAEVRS